MSTDVVVYKRGLTVSYAAVGVPRRVTDAEVVIGEAALAPLSNPDTVRIKHVREMDDDELREWVTITPRFEMEALLVAAESDDWRYITARLQRLSPGTAAQQAAFRNRPWSR